MEDIIIPLISFVLIIGTSLLKSRSGNKKTSDRQTQIKPKQRPTVYETVPQEPAYTDQVKADQTPVSTNAMEDQLADLRKKLSVDTRKETQRKVRDSKRKFDQMATERKIKVQKSVKQSPIALKGQLTKTGLKRSVIMAEVLSPPRGKKPFGSGR